MPTPTRNFRFNVDVTGVADGRQEIEGFSAALERLDGNATSAANALERLNRAAAAQREINQAATAQGKVASAAAATAKSTTAADDALEKYLRRLALELRTLRESIAAYDSLGRARQRVKAAFAAERGGPDAFDLQEGINASQTTLGTRDAERRFRRRRMVADSRRAFRYSEDASVDRLTAASTARARNEADELAAIEEEARERLRNAQRAQQADDREFEQQRREQAKERRDAIEREARERIAREEQEDRQRRRRLEVQAREEARRYRREQREREQGERSIRREVAASELQARVYREVRAAGGTLAEAQIRLRAEQLRLRGATDAQVRSFERAQREMLQYGRAAGAVRRAQDGMVASLSRFAGRAVVAASAFQLVYGTARKVREGYNFIIEANSELEQARLGIAGTITVAGEYVDTLGKALPIAQQLNIAFAEGETILTKLLELSARRGLNFEGLRDTQVSTAGITRAAGFTPDQQVEVIAGIATLAQRLGIAQGRVVRTLDNILKGYRLSQTELGTILGLSDKQVENWRSQGQLAENLLRIIAGVRETQEENLATYQGITEAIRSQGILLSTQAGGGLFDGVKDAAEIIRQGLEDITDSPERIGRIADQFSRIGNSIESLTGSLVNFIANIRGGDLELAGVDLKSALIGAATGGALRGPLGAVFGGAAGYGIGRTAQFWEEFANGRVGALDFVAANSADRDAILRDLYNQDAAALARSLQADEDARSLASRITSGNLETLLGPAEEINLGDAFGAGPVPFGPGGEMRNRPGSGVYLPPGYDPRETPAEPKKTRGATARRARTSTEDIRRRIARELADDARNRSRQRVRDFQFAQRAIEADFRLRGVAIDSEQIALEAQGAVTGAQSERMGANGASRFARRAMLEELRAQELQGFSIRRRSIENRIEQARAQFTDTNRRGLELPSDATEQERSAIALKLAETSRERAEAEAELQALQGEVAASTIRFASAIEELGGNLGSANRAARTLGDTLASGLVEGDIAGAIAGVIRTEVTGLLGDVFTQALGGNSGSGGIMGAISGLFGGGQGAPDVVGMTGADGTTQAVASGATGAAAAGGLGAGGIAVTAALAAFAGFSGASKAAKNYTPYTSSKKYREQVVQGFYDGIGLGFLGKIENAIGIAPALLKLFGIKKPSTEKLVNKALDKVYEELGLPVAPVGMFSRRGFSNEDRGNFPELQSLAQAGAIEFGLDRRGRVRKPGRGEVNPDTLANQIVNNAAQLFLSFEDARSQVRQVNQAIGGDFDSQANKLIAQRAARINAFTAIPRLQAQLDRLGSGATEASRTGGTPALFLQAQLREALKITEGVDRGSINREFVDQLSQIVDTFLELPESVDRTKVALVALGADGTVNMERLQRAAEDVSGFFSSGLGGALQAAIEGSDYYAPGAALADSLFDTFTSRLEERLVTEGAIGKFLDGAAIEASLAAEALARGNQGEYQRRSMNAARLLTQGRTVANETLGRIGADVRAFEAALGIPSANGIVMGGDMPAIPALPRRNAPTGQDAFISPATNATAQRALAVQEQQLAYLRALAAQGSAGGQPIVLVADGAQLARVVTAQQAKDATLQRSGVNHPSSGIGV